MEAIPNRTMEMVDFAKKAATFISLRTFVAMSFGTCPDPFASFGKTRSSYSLLFSCQGKPFSWLGSICPDNDVQYKQFVQWA